jgi:hypothetical protein
MSLEADNCEVPVGTESISDGSCVCAGGRRCALRRIKSRYSFCGHERIMTLHGRADGRIQ